MKGIGYRCDICGATATVDDSTGPVVPPEGWVILSFPKDNPFGATFEDQAHACSWEHAAAVSLERSGMAS